MRILIVLVALGAVIPAALAKLPPPPAQTAAIPTGQAPCGLATHGGELWVGVYEAGTVLRLDRAGRVLRRHRVGRYACHVAVDNRAAWVTRDNANAVVRIDRRTGRRQVVEVVSPFDVLLAAGAVWVTSGEKGEVVRIDPVTGRRTHVVRVGGRPAGIAFCGGRIWVGLARNATWLVSIDPVTRRISRVPAGTLTPGAPHCIGGALWVITPDSVVRIDPRTGRILSSLRVSETLAGALAGPDGLVWVTDKQHSVVHRLDPSGGSVVDSFPAGPGAFELARLGRSTWITSFAGADVRRYDMP